MKSIMIHVKVWWLWENNTSFLLQHITSRGTQLAPLEQRRPQASSSAQGGRTLSPTSPTALRPLPALEWCWVRILGGQYDVPAGCYIATLAPCGVTPSSSTTCCPNKIELSVPFDPVSCTRTACSFMVHSGSPGPPSLFFLNFFFAAFLQPTTGPE